LAQTQSDAKLSSWHSSRAIADGVLRSVCALRNGATPERSKMRVEGGDCSESHRDGLSRMFRDIFTHYTESIFSLSLSLSTELRVRLLLASQHAKNKRVNFKSNEKHRVKFSSISKYLHRQGTMLIQSKKKSRKNKTRRNVEKVEYL
jgi:tRNA pseudouridine-54 N-methylase